MKELVKLEIGECDFCNTTAPEVTSFEESGDVFSYCRFCLFARPEKITDPRQRHLLETIIYIANVIRLDLRSLSRTT